MTNKTFYCACGAILKSTDTGICQSCIAMGKSYTKILIG